MILETKIIKMKSFIKKYALRILFINVTLHTNRKIKRIWHGCYNPFWSILAKTNILHEKDWINDHIFHRNVLLTIYSTLFHEDEPPPTRNYRSSDDSWCTWYHILAHHRKVLMMGLESAPMYQWEVFHHLFDPFHEDELPPTR